MLHTYFDDLRDEKTTLPNGGALPDLFNFSSEELLAAPNQSIVESLVPDWYKEKADKEKQKQKR